LNQLYTYKEAANYLAVCERTVWSLVNTKKLKAVYIGRSVRITHEAIKDFLNNSEKVRS